MLRTYARLLGYLRPYKKSLVGALLSMGVLALTTGAYAFLVGPALEFLMSGGHEGAEAFDRLLWGIDLSTLDRDRLVVILPIVIVILGLVKGASYFAQFYLMGMVGQRVVVDLRRHMFRHLLSLSPGWFSHHHSGDLISRFTHDVRAVETAVTYAAATVVRDALQVIVLLVVAFYLDWRLSIIAFGVIPVTLYPIIRFAKRLRKVTGQSNRVMGRITELVHEVVGGIRVVQAYNMQRYEDRRFNTENDGYVSVMRRSFLVRAASTPTMEVMAVVGVAATIWYAAGAVDSGALDPAAFLSFFATVALLYQPVKQLGRMQQFVVTGAASAERLFEILDMEPEIADAPDARPLGSFSEAIRFEEVRFRYAEREVLKGVDLTVERGRVVALVGPSGGGKTTLANLILRFYDVSSGRITCDGTDLREATLGSLREQLALVSQDTIIFNDSVRANVTYGKPDVSDAKVWEALGRAHARVFVEALPQGLDTPLGERGVNLSGGQRQRLAIARALIKDAPILILDEATSNLDAESERAVQDALSELMAGRTVIVIAHRLSTIRDADRVVVIDEGEIVEEGTPSELLARGGLFKRLHDLQQAEPASPAQAVGA